MERELLAKGKRGIVYLDTFKGKIIAVKTLHPKTTSVGRIEIEAQFLRKLNKYNIGPQLLFYKDDELGMEYIEGELFEKYIQNNSKEKIMKVIKKLFDQLYQMDKLGITKEEMHRPVKHIIVRENKPVLIDFERCHYSEKPKNITQFVQYLHKILPSLEEKDVSLDDNWQLICRQYTNKEISYEEVVSLVK